MSSPFLTAEELAGLLRVSAYTVKAWARRIGPDALPSYRAGKRVVFDPDEALAWFRETQRRTPAAPAPRRRLRRPRRIGSGRGRGGRRRGPSLPSGAPGDQRQGGPGAAVPVAGVVERRA